MKFTRPDVPFDLEAIERDTRSENQGLRGQAMQNLLLQARKDSSIHPRALEIFRRSLLMAPDSWTAISAARGIGLIAGPTEGRQAWLALLNRSDPVMVAHVAAAINENSFVPVLIDVLRRRSEKAIKVSVIRALGRLKDPIAFPALVEQLMDPQLRPHAVEALGDLGDVRAIPLLESLLDDNTDAWMEDNHGGMLRVCDLANSVIIRLRADTSHHVDSFANKSQPVPPESKYKMAVSPPDRARNLPICVLAYIPLMALVLEIPWLGAVIIGQLYMTGRFAPNESQAHRLTAIAIIPVIVGLIAGMKTMLRRTAHRLIDRIFLGLGFAGCGLIIAWLGQEFFR